jgi:alcohol dehydrogenase (NADP+)
LRAPAIGGIAETQEIVGFCSQHNLTAEVEVILIQKINEPYDRLPKSDVRYRFSIDSASLEGR